MTIVQIVGATLVLAAFALTQRGTLAADTYLVLLLNAAGASILATLAGLDRQWGFFLLNAVWLLVSVVGLLSRIGDRLPRRTPAAPSNTADVRRATAVGPSDCSTEGGFASAQGAAE